ncbi:MAG: FAD synthase, partial [Candidatus Nanohaloarchaea archaeon]
DSRLEDAVMPEEARREVVDALEMVDGAVLGSEDSIFDSVERIQPDVVTLGYDQDFQEGELEEELRAEGFTEVRVTRIEGYDGEIVSSSQIRERVRENG